MAVTLLRPRSARQTPFILSSGSVATATLAASARMSLRSPLGGDATCPLKPGNSKPKGQVQQSARLSANLGLADGACR